MGCTELVDRYCEVWSETDPRRRDELLASVWTKDATYTDPTVSALDGESLLAHIEKIQLTRPGARVVRSTTVDEHHGHARFGFRVIGTDGAILREGTDFAQLSPAGDRITQVIGFFGPLVPTDS